MKSLISISARVLLMVFAGAAILRTDASAGSLGERFKVSLNTAIQNVKETQNADAKRTKLEEFLTRMDQGLGMAKIGASEKDAQALTALQLKLRSDKADLMAVGSAKIPNAELNQFAGYVQQDMEQADGGVYISVGGLIIILILLLILLR